MRDRPSRSLRHRTHEKLVRAFLARGSSPDASECSLTGGRTVARRAYKQRAAARGTTLAQEIEDALRAELRERGTADAQDPFEALVFDGDGSRALIDVNDNRALQDLVDEEDRTAGGQ